MHALLITDPWLQVEDPAMRWQMSLYKEMAGKAEDADDPEKVVKRVQEVSAVLYHIEVVSGMDKLSTSLLFLCC